MEIVKNLRDFKLTPQQRLVLGFLQDSVSAYSCHVTIKNKDYIRRYMSPENDFTIYTTGVADPNLILRRAV